MMATPRHAILCSLAYLDPASGSLLLQLILGGVAGIGVALRVYWRRLATRFGLKKSGDDANPT